MKKQEVLTLLERFPDLVDADELIQDLFREAGCDSIAISPKPDPERKQPAPAANEASDRLFDRHR